ncbi:extracellular calcium-sensing receptor-like [Ambystoma mexicanum]|uniref:extracellular calcium-sensing receptor-like n=1 Tax=Ambystoma mexicanum TaxID=8296 RepID=UPI0037E7D943
MAAGRVCRFLLRGRSSSERSPTIICAPDEHPRLSQEAIRASSPLLAVSGGRLLRKVFLEAACTLRSWEPESYSRDGDIIIGGVFVVHSEFTSSELTFKEEPKPVSCDGFYIRYYRDVVAMVFAIEEINRTPDLLPNVTLGFRICDSCASDLRALRRSLELLSGKKELVPGYGCPNHPVLAGIIGDTFSSLTVPIARVLGALNYPQISHSSVLPTLSDKMQFPSFLRTVPSNAFQNIALARLTSHFGWTWVGMIIADTESGLQGGQDIKRQIEKEGGCVAFMERISPHYPHQKVLQLVEFIRRHTVQVIIVHSSEVAVKALLEALYRLKVDDKVWIFSASFAITQGLFSNQSWRILNGALGLAPYTESMPGFEEFLQRLHPSTSSDDIFVQFYWEQAFKCSWPRTNETKTTVHKEQVEQIEVCSGEEMPGNKAMALFELEDLSYTYHSYLAVYAFAQAIDTLIACIPGHGPFSNGACANLNELHQWQILHYLKNLHSEPGSKVSVSFDVNGDVPASYNILNIQISQNGDFKTINVGKLSPKETDYRDFVINTSAIHWTDGSAKVPRSVCSESCLPGYRKAAREEEPRCCYDCVPCSLGEVSNATDSIECLKCPDDHWSNERRDQCIPKSIEFLSFEEPLGLTLTMSASTMTLLTASVMCVFIKFRDTPIVKANNLGLSYLLLLSLMLCFLCSFIFVGCPQKITCVLRQTVFGIVFSISISAVLAKTVVVVIAFRARNPGSRARKWLGSKTPKSIVAFCSLVQVAIYLAWCFTYSPFPEVNMKSNTEKIIIECNEGDTIFLYCMLGYMGVLATISFIVAFLSRNLPGSFNEAKLITFSMLVFVSVWIAFIPAYLSTRGKYMVAAEVFAILCSSAGLLGCIFFPKCYIILIRPDRNTREQLTGKVKLVIKKTE